MVAQADEFVHLVVRQVLIDGQVCVVKIRCTCKGRGARVRSGRPRQIAEVSLVARICISPTSWGVSRTDKAIAIAVERLEGFPDVALAKRRHPF